MHTISEKSFFTDGHPFVVDFGKDAFATLEIEYDLAEDADLTICVGEKLDAAGWIERNPGGFRIFRECTRHCGKGRGSFLFPVEIFCNPYKKSSKTQHFIDLPLPQGAKGELLPFRYVEVGSCKGSLTLRRDEFFCDFDDNAADFKCSDQRLNRIWDFCKYSVKATACFGVYIDGNRERRPYEGDSFINQLSHFCCDRNYAIAKDTIDLLFQHPTWPKEWRLLMPLLVRDYVLYSGDVASIPRWKASVEESLLLEYANEDGLLNDVLLKDNPTTMLRDIVDWPAVERDEYEFGITNTVPNSYLYGALLATHWLTGEKRFAERAEAVKMAMHRLMYKENRFVDNPMSSHTALHSVFFPLYFSLADLTEEMKTIILSKGMCCSVYAAQFLLEACFKSGLAQHGIDLMVATGLHSWQNMLEKGATVTMEAWDDSLKPNQDWNHAWASAPANIMPRFIAGIRPVEPGFAKFVVEPNFCNLEWVKAKQPTPAGEICLEMQDGKHLQLTVPDGTLASFMGREYAAGVHTFSI
ncbi:MAG: hypothetical protein J5746_13165 [Victivallales bacterium]|nr:hypothetical protein [Victivallales bacterium]